uniref:Uncharacterized protein n=1 Tax=Glossina austeni TaxID=7395 RepID=A0A1A9UD37_GLOAU
MSQPTKKFFVLVVGTVLVFMFLVSDLNCSLTLSIEVNQGGTEFDPDTDQSERSARSLLLHKERIKSLFESFRASYNSWLAVFDETKADALLSEINSLCSSYNLLRHSGITESKFGTPRFKSELTLLNVGSNPRIGRSMSNTQKKGYTIDCYKEKNC